jgi:hypothetical protein
MVFSWCVSRPDSTDSSNPWEPVASCPVRRASDPSQRGGSRLVLTRAVAGLTPERRAASQAHCPMPRLCEPNDVTKAPSSPRIRRCLVRQRNAADGRRRRHDLHAQPRCLEPRRWFSVAPNAQSGSSAGIRLPRPTITTPTIRYRRFDDARESAHAHMPLAIASGPTAAASWRSRSPAG